MFGVRYANLLLHKQSLQFLAFLLRYLDRYSIDCWKMLKTEKFHDLLCASFQAAVKSKFHAGFFHF